MTDATGSRTMNYDSTKPWRLNTETESNFYGNRALGRQYDNATSFGRVNGLYASPGLGSEVMQSFGFTSDGRFQTLTSSSDFGGTSQTFRYTYRSDAELLQSLTVDGNSFAVTRGYEDHRDLVTSIDSQWSTTSHTRYDYAYDAAGLRTSIVQSGDAFADYGNSTFRLLTYDGRGELTADVWYLGANISDQSKPLPSRRHEFGFDNAGNRLWGNHTGVDTLREHYATNAGNGIISRENNSQASTGSADPAASVSVDGTAAGRQGAFFSGEVLAPTSSAAQNYTFPVTITPGSTTTRSLLFFPGSQTINYDADGNLSSDGLWDYTWDGENRLIRMTTSSVAATSGMPNREIDFTYDYLGRRVQKRVLDLTAGTGGSWSDIDIGTTGGSHADGPPLTVTGSGSDIYGTSDEFHFTYQTLMGDGTIVATVDGVTNVNAWTKAGIMIREDLSGGSRNAFVGYAPSQNVFFQSRSAAGGSTNGSPNTFAWTPVKLRLVRSGDTITSSSSEDNGNTWTQLGTVTLTGLANSVYVGLAVTSHVAGTTATGTFEGVTITSTGSGAVIYQHRYLYDGWNLIADYSFDAQPSTLSLFRTYTWGPEIAQSMTNAGGVGTLLQIFDSASGKIYFPTYDGNGNIVSLISAATGSVAAVYEYGPFGESLRAQTIDATIADNPWRFSTKWIDTETGLVYYGHRYYDPRNGRFINRDPIEEAGGLNLYGSCGNDAINRSDMLGNIASPAFDRGGRQVTIDFDGDYSHMPDGYYATPYQAAVAREGILLANLEYGDAGTKLAALSGLIAGAQNGNSPVNAPKSGGDAPTTATAPNSSFAVSRSRMHPAFSEGVTIDDLPDPYPDDNGYSGVNLPPGDSIPVLSYHVPNSPYVTQVMDGRKPNHSDIQIKAYGRTDEERMQNENAIRAVLDQLRDLKTSSDGALTQGALLLRALENTGLASMITIDGRAFSQKVDHVHGHTQAMDPNGDTARDGASMARRGDRTAAKITLEGNGADAAAALAHELGHTTQIVLGLGGYQTDANEDEPTRIGNQALYALGQSGAANASRWITDTYDSGKTIAGWNRYIPWVTEASWHGGPHG